MGLVLQVLEVEPPNTIIGILAVSNLCFVDSCGYRLEETYLTHMVIVKRKATQHELRSPTDKMARSEYVFRGAGPNSGGINNPQGLIAGMYKQLPMAGVPSMDDIGRPGGRWSMTLKELEMRTKSHFDRTNNIPTPWISTSPSLEKALAYMIEFCPNDGFIFVIRIDDCQDIFDAEDMTEALPGIGKLLRNKWQAVMDDEGKIDEYVIFGKVPRHAIAATISGPRLLSCEALYTVGPPVALHVQAKLNKRPSQKVLEQLERRVPHKISNTLLTAAIEVVSRFEGADENCFFWVVRVLLGTDFQNPYEERQDGRRVRQAVEGFLLGRMMLQNET